MDIGNVMIPSLVESKMQNPGLGKAENFAGRQVNSDESFNSENGEGISQALFKELLISKISGRQFSLKGNAVKAGELKEELLTEQGAEPSAGNVENEQSISPLDIKMILNNASLSKNQMKIEGESNHLNVESEVSAPVAKIDKSENSNHSTNYIGKLEGDLESNSAKITEKAREGNLPEGINSSSKIASNNSTFLKTSKEMLNQTVIPEKPISENAEASEPVAGNTEKSMKGLENKTLNQEKQDYLKETNLRGIERAAYNNGKEINLEKVEKLADIKEKNDEKPVRIEEGEPIIGMHKPGSIENNPIEVETKNQKLENVPVYNQIAEEIASKLEQKGPMEFKLQLKPDNLGEIDISIKISDGKLSIDVSSASSKTQDLLVSQVDKLISRLGMQNVQVENIQVIPNGVVGNQDTGTQSSLINLGMNFSDRRQQENLKEQNNSRKGLRNISTLRINEKEASNGLSTFKGKSYLGEKISYSF